MKVVNRVEIHEVIQVILLLGSIRNYLMLLLWHPLLQLECIVSWDNHLTVIILHTIKTIVWSKQLHLV